MNIKYWHNIFSNTFNQLRSFSLLGLRLILSYGFYEPAQEKWKDIDSVADWFKSIGIPFPVINAYLSATFEMLGVFLLVMGLFTRYISLGLIIIMIVAITFVHWDNGFSSSNNGYEIPLYYLLMLFVLLSYGSGKWSLDYFLFERHSPFNEK